LQGNLAESTPYLLERLHSSPGAGAVLFHRAGAGFQQDLLNWLVR
jgi:hypothetical protein